jgi:hypothetical protein
MSSTIINTRTLIVTVIPLLFLSANVGPFVVVVVFLSTALLVIV